MKNILLLVCAFLLASSLHAQLNMTLRSQITYDQDCNDIWGYVAPDSTEYAIVGIRNGVSIVSLADPDNAVEVDFVNGQSSTWRDIKTWGEYAYVVTDQNGTTEGVTVIDMRTLPDSVSSYHWTPTIDSLGGKLETCHNIYIDEDGYAYLAGCNLNGGGMLIVDVFSEPGVPSLVAPAPAQYAHDVYVRDNIMYSSEISNGILAIYDVNDKQNISLLGFTATPRNFTHNAWLSDDSNTIFTTDERPNAPVASYDISDPTDIIELDQYRPAETLGDGVIPHNVHVWEDWLIISYYTDGIIIVDASRPQNMVEVGEFDTFLGLGTGFSGVWGAYPFLPSGLVLASDINSGLYVFSANYVRAAWLEGKVTDAVTGQGLTNVSVRIDADQPNLDITGLGGAYATGIATAGTYDVTFRIEGYAALTVPAVLQNGELTTLDVELQPLDQIVFTGLVRDAVTQEGIGNAQIELVNEVSKYSQTASGNGEFALLNIFEETYDIYIADWGYRQLLAEDVPINADSEQLVFDLVRGYEDDFAVDLGWTTDMGENVERGLWTRGVPIGTAFGSSLSNPNADIEGDYGQSAYVTGNGGGAAGTDDVDGGFVSLTSPYMDLTGASTASLSYYLWFFNDSGTGAPDDALQVIAQSPDETVVIETVTESMGSWREQSMIQLEDFITLRDSMQIIFLTADEGSGNLVEAAVDVFRVDSDIFTATNEPWATAAMRVWPNPTDQAFILDYRLEAGYRQAQLEVINVLGQPVIQQPVTAEFGRINFGDRLDAGTYFVRLLVDGKATQSMRVLKVK